MGKDCGSWVHQQCPPHQAPNLNCASFVPDSAPWPNALPDSADRSCLVSTEPKQGCTGYKLPQFKTGLGNGPQGWFYGLPRYRQALTSSLSPECASKELNAHPEGGGGGGKDTTVNVAPASRTIEKKFLVFDHSGNQTRLIYSPGTAYSNRHLNIGNSNELQNGGFQIDKWRSLTNLKEAGPINSHGHEESLDRSETREDTEELNALLYSDEEDEDDNYDCDEETSTGHSPSKITAGVKAEVIASGEEVASSSGCHLKRKRLLKEEYGGNSSLMDTASSGKPNGSSECEDDAESSCGESSNHGEEMGLLPLNKRMKREKIRETVNILQNIIPGGKGKDAIYVLDEAIHYLKSLKLKAKTLGESLE